MHLLFTILSAGFGIMSLVASIYILVEAFRDEIWKGILCILCGFYFLWYAIFDFDADNKWLWVLLSLGGGAIAGCLQAVAH